MLLGLEICRSKFDRVESENNKPRMNIDRLENEARTNMKLNEVSPNSSTNLKRHSIFKRLRRRTSCNLMLTSSFIVAILYTICNIFLVVECTNKKFLSGFLIALLLCKCIHSSNDLLAQFDCRTTS